MEVQTAERTFERQGTGRARNILDDSQRQALRQVVEDGPVPAVHDAGRWRLVDLAQWAFDEFRVSISKQTLSRELRAMGFHPHLEARYHWIS